MTGQMEYSLLLLAGGKSSRMGVNKAELQVDGKSFLTHMRLKASAIGIEQHYISGYSSESEDVTTVWDRYPDRGPLGGIHACMEEMDTPYCLVLPVDAPTLPVEILETLLAYHRNSPDRKQVLIWEHGDRKEPLIAIYPKAMAETIESLITDGPAPVFRALDCWGYHSLRLEMEEEREVNINTPELYQKLLERFAPA